MNTRMLSLAIHSLRQRSFRSWLTVIGIIVSIAVIFILLTLSSGLQIAVTELFEDFGTNRLFIIPGGGVSSVGGLNSDAFLEKDVDSIESLPFIEDVIPQLFRSAQLITYKGEEAYVNINGLPNENTDFVGEQYNFDTDLDEGRFFREREKNVAVIGYDVAHDNDNFFKKDVGLKYTIEISGKRFEVIGIYKELGTVDDQNIYIALEDAREVIDVPEEIDFIDAIVVESVDMDQAKARVERLLERTKGEDTFEVISPESIIRQFNNTIFIVQTVLLAIASVSLIVGAIGIANTMFTSVLEREKEIGILKAVGARNSDILQLFMFESGLIGLLGGVVGILLGAMVSFFVGFIAAQSGFDFLVIEVNIYYVLFCLGFAFIVGVLSGFIPAYLASRKLIIQVLRDT